MTQNSLLPEMAKSNGTDFLELCEILLSNAECEVHNFFVNFIDITCSQLCDKE